MKNEDPEGGPLLTVRAALILLMALFVAWLTHAATRNPAQAAIAAVFAFGGTVLSGMKIVH